MTGKIHKTHFQVTKDAPWKRPVTISYVKGEGVKCDFCDDYAEYGMNGQLYCLAHWKGLKK